MTTTKKKLQITVDKDVAVQAEEVLNKMGMTPSSAINIFYSQIANTGEFPFKITTKENEINTKIDADRAMSQLLSKMEKENKVEHLDTPDKLRKWVEQNNEEDGFD